MHENMKKAYPSKEEVHAVAWPIAEVHPVIAHTAAALENLRLGKV